MLEACDALAWHGDQGKSHFVLVKYEAFPVGVGSHVIDQALENNFLSIANSALSTFLMLKLDVQI